jgi:hypothetical protein
VDVEAIGHALWERFTGGAENTRWHYREVARVSAETTPGPLTDRLSLAVAGFA